MVNICKGHLALKTVPEKEKAKPKIWLMQGDGCFISCSWMYWMRKMRDWGFSAWTIKALNIRSFSKGFCHQIHRKQRLFTIDMLDSEVFYPGYALCVFIQSGASSVAGFELTLCYFTMVNDWLIPGNAGLKLRRYELMQNQTALICFTGLVETSSHGELSH